MRRVQQQSMEQADCGVACVAMIADCSYQKAFEAFGFAHDRQEFYTRHHHLISALETLGFEVKRKLFRSWSDISGRAIVAVNHRGNGYWHWVVFDGKAILDPKPDRMERKTDLRGLHGKGQYLLIDDLKH